MLFKHYSFNIRLLFYVNDIHELYVRVSNGTGRACRPGGVRPMAQSGAVHQSTGRSGRALGNLRLVAQLVGPQVGRALAGRVGRVLGKN